LSILT